MNKHNKIAAIVVTYNRKELLIECIQSLVNQSYKIDKIIIIDNASNDGTESLLRKNGLLDSNQIDYVKLTTNMGGSGGFYTGLKKAYQEKYDWMWVMDDDAKVDYYALEKLIDNIGRSQALASSIRLWDDSNEYDMRVIDAVCRTALDFYCKKFNTKDFERPSLRIYGYPMLGLLLSRKVLDKVGFPNPEFFIQSDDIDFTLRISSKYNILLIRNSLLYHFSHPSNITETKVFLNKKWLFLKPEYYWKEYYGIRNYLYLYRNYNGLIKSINFIINKYVKESIKIFLVNKHRKYILEIYFNGIHDGLKGSLGINNNYLPGVYNRK